MIKKLLTLFLLFLVLVVGGVSASLTDDIVSYYKFDENTGTVAGDSVGSNDSTINGATWTTGKINSGLDFDGTNDNVDTNNRFFSSGEFAINLWVYPERSAVEGLVGQHSGADSQRSFLYLNNRDISIQIAGTAHSTGTLATLNEWQMITATRDSSNIVRLYKNGVQIGSNYSNSGTWQNIDLFIGSNSGSQFYFQGLLDEVGLWNRALTADEVEELYNNGNGLQYPFPSLNFDIITLNNQTLTNEMHINSTNANFTINVSENSNISYILDGLSKTSICSECNFTTLNLTNLSEITHNITFIAETESSNINQTYNFTVDITDPIINNSFPAEINTYQINVSNFFTCTDTNIEICTVTFPRENVTMNQTNESYTFTYNGNQTYELYAKDLAGNEMLLTSTMLVNPFQRFEFRDANNTLITNYTWGGIEYNNESLIKTYDLGLGNHSLLFDKLGFLKQNLSIEFTNTSNIDQTFNMSFSAINIFIRDKSTFNLVTGKNFTVELIESGFGASASTTTGNVTFTNLFVQPGEYRAIASNVDYFAEDIFFNFDNQEIINLTLYVTEKNLTNAGIINLGTVDQLGNPVSNILVQALQWDAGSSQFIRVSEGRTGLDGRVPLNVILEDKVYIFRALLNGQQIDSPEYRLLASDNNKNIFLTVASAGTVRDYLFQALSYNISLLSYENNLAEFRLAWTDLNGLEQTLCFNEYRFVGVQETRVNVNCETGVSNTFLQNYLINSSYNIRIKAEVKVGDTYYTLRTFNFPGTTSLPKMIDFLELQWVIIPLLMMIAIALAIKIETLWLGGALIIGAAGLSIFAVPTLINSGIVAFIMFLGLLITWIVSGGRR